MSISTKISLTPDDHDIQSFDVRCGDTHIHFKTGLVNCTSDCVYLTPAEIEASLVLNPGEKFTVLEDVDILHVRRDSRRPRFYVVLKPGVRIGSMYAAALTLNEMVEFAKTVGVKVPVQPGEVRMSPVATSGVGVSFHAGATQGTVATPPDLKARLASVKFSDADIKTVTPALGEGIIIICASLFFQNSSESRILLRPKEIKALNEAVNGGSNGMDSLWNIAEKVQEARRQITQQYQDEVDRLTSELAQQKDVTAGAMLAAEVNGEAVRQYKAATHAATKGAQRLAEELKSSTEARRSLEAEVRRLTSEREGAYSSGKKFALENLTFTERSRIHRGYMEERIPQIAAELNGLPGLQEPGARRSAHVAQINCMKTLLAFPKRD